MAPTTSDASAPPKRTVNLKSVASVVDSALNAPLPSTRAPSGASINQSGRLLQSAVRSSRGSGVSSSDSAGSFDRSKRDWHEQRFAPGDGNDRKRKNENADAYAGKRHQSNTQNGDYFLIFR